MFLKPLGLYQSKCRKNPIQLITKQFFSENRLIGKLNTENELNSINLIIYAEIHLIFIHCDDYENKVEFYCGYKTICFPNVPLFFILLNFT